MSKFNTLKRKFKERLGAISDGEKSEIPAVRDQIVATESFRINVERLVKSMSKFEKSLKGYATAGSELADSAYDFKIESNAVLNKNMLSACLEKVSDYQRTLADSWKGLSEKIEGDVQVYLKFLLIGELKEAKEIISRYDNARLSYDAAVSEATELAAKKAKPTRVKAAEDMVAKYKANFELTGKETLSQLLEINMMTECEVIERLCDYIDLMRESFQNMYRYLNELLPFLYQVRQVSSEKKYERSARQEQHKLELSQEAAAAIPQTQIFGVPLDEIVQREKTDIPNIVVDCIRWLENTKGDTEGLFRVAASATELSARKKAADSEGRVNLDGVDDPHLVAGLLKAYFRDLPEPLLTWELYQKFIETNNYKDDDKIIKLKATIEQLPPNNLRVLHYLIGFLHKLTQQHAITKMSAANLATCFAPNILSPKDMDLEKFDPFERNAVVEHIILNFEKLFDGPYVPAQVSPRQQSASAAASPLSPEIKKESSVSQLDSSNRSRTQSKVPPPVPAKVHSSSNKSASEESPRSGVARTPPARPPRLRSASVATMRSHKIQSAASNPPEVHRRLSTELDSRNTNSSQSEVDEHQSPRSPRPLTISISPRVYTDAQPEDTCRSNKLEDVEEVQESLEVDE